MLGLKLFMSVIGPWSPCFTTSTHCYINIIVHIILLVWYWGSDAIHWCYPEKSMYFWIELLLYVKHLPYDSISPDIWGMTGGSRAPTPGFNPLPSPNFPPIPHPFFLFFSGNPRPKFRFFPPPPWPFLSKAPPIQPPNSRAPAPSPPPLRYISRHMQPLPLASWWRYDTLSAPRSRYEGNHLSPIDSHKNYH